MTGQLAQLTGATRLLALSAMRSLFGTLAFAAFAADDPWPAVADLPVMAGRLLTRRFGRTRIRRRRAATTRNRPATSV